MVPDSFEIRATSTEGTWGALADAILTIRWEVEAGGDVHNGDVQTGCGGYTLLNYGGMVDIADHRYFTLVMLGDRPLQDAGCAITTDGIALAGIRIRELSGCRHVELVSNAYTLLNNLGYYFSVGGNMTGEITSGPIPGGECGPCDPPVIAQAVATGFPDCGDQQGPIHFAASVIGYAPEFAWYIDGASQPFHYLSEFTLPTGSLGTYHVVASNLCGSDTATVVAMHDTTGLGACVAPQILNIATNGPVCAGDTLLLEAEVIADGPCLSYQWSGANVLQSGGPATIAPAASGTNYTLTVGNACGSASMSVQAPIITQQNHYVVLCSPQGLLDLDSIAAMALPPGSWYYYEAPHSGYYDPAVDTSGHYFYRHDPLGCPVVRLSLWEYDAVYAGADTSITVCSSDEPFELFGFLGPDAMPGGTWTFGMASMDGIYDPQVHGSHTYQYRVINGGCNDIALVHVTEIPATPWYADTDGDGHGDPNEELLACDPPGGYVANTDDTCPNLPGLMGDACDDGDPATVNDVINEECICAGEIYTGVVEQGAGTSLLWPNPTRGDVFYLQLPQTVGTVQVTITDATGRTVLRRNFVASSAPMEVQLPGGIAAGTYFVGIVSDAGAEVKRLVVGR